MLPRSLHIFCALSLAINYLAFQVELFEEEYEENHRRIASELSLDSPSVSWESFDKENAPKAFNVEPRHALRFVQYLKEIDGSDQPLLPSTDPVRDKSPPPSL